MWKWLFSDFVALSPLGQKLFSVHPQIETAGEMLKQVHNGVCPINALKVAIDCRLLGVAITLTLAPKMQIHMYPLHSISDEDLEKRILRHVIIYSYTKKEETT